MGLFSIFNKKHHYTDKDIHDKKNEATSKFLEIQQKAEIINQQSKEIARNSREIKEISRNIAIATGGKARGL